METNVEKKHPNLRRGIYLLPNLFTTAALFAGFYSVVSAMKGNFDVAALAIFIAMIADALDGRVARMTNTQSEFGVEYDSLSDMVSFGVAPALIIYSWALSPLGKLGWLVSFLFTAMAALRLARFNSQAETADKRYFQGLPVPSAAAVVASLIWVGSEFAWRPQGFAWMIALLTALLGLLMVSNVRYYSFKEIDFKGKVPFIAVLLVVLVFVTISINPPTVLFAVFLGYALSGPILTLHTLRKKRQQRKKDKGAKDTNT